MVQELITWCTIHYDKGEQRRGTPMPFGLAEPDQGKWRDYEVDLCPECEGHVRTFLNGLIEHARLVGSAAKPRGRVAGALTASAGSGSDAPSEKGEKCPMCDEHPASRDALNSHLRTHHDTSLAELDGTAKVPCELTVCPRRFKNKTGLKAHLRIAHPAYYAEHHAA